MLIMLREITESCSLKHVAKVIDPPTMMSPSVDEVFEKLFLKKSVIQPDIKVKIN